MLTILISCAPGLSLLLWLAFECPEVWKRRILRIPTWITSNAIGFIIMAISSGVMGVTVGFVTDIILTIGLWMLHKQMVNRDRKLEKKKEKERKYAKECGFKGDLAS